MPFPGGIAPNEAYARQPDSERMCSFQRQNAIIRALATPWFWREVFIPFGASRLVLLLAAWFGGYFPRDRAYPIVEDAVRGWSFVPWRALDMWGRWDTGYYIHIAQHGYPAGANPFVAFFPAYPALVRAVASVAGPEPSTRALYIAAVVVSNAAAVAALAVLYRLAKDILGGEDDAGRAVLYLLAFPTGLFLSCAYSEALFLLLGVATFRFGVGGRWALAGTTGLFLALTRPVGVLFFVPLAWMYLESVAFDLRRVRGDVAWLALVPAGLALYACFGWWLTGDPLGIFHVQSRWERSLSWPWITFAHPRGWHPFMTPVDRTLTVTFAALGVWGLFAFRSRSLGILLLLLIVPTLTSGTLMSSARFLSVGFPAFLLLARLGRHPLFDRIYLLGAMALQALLMAAWSQFYWLG